VEEPLGQLLGLMVTHAWVAGEFVVDQADAAASDGGGEPRRWWRSPCHRPRHEPRPGAAGLLLLGDDQAAALELLAGLAEPGGASVSRVAAYQEDATP
jgi:hypothetical protein